MNHRAILLIAASGCLSAPAPNEVDADASAPVVDPCGGPTDTADPVQLSGTVLDYDSGTPLAD